EREILRLGLQMAEGIAAAHEQGVIHRDLKPGNLRVTPDGWLKILDFGLARSAAIAAVEETATEASIGKHVEGTLRYMAPEQLLGESVDSRTDIYALGSVLYEMATGQAPFDNKLTAALVDAILHQPPRPPRQLNSSVSPRLEEIILKCLDKDAGNRYQSAKELAVDLRRLAPSTFTATLPTVPRRFPRRGIVLAAAVLAIVVVLALASARHIRLPWSLAGTRGVRTIAVLPLQNLSGDPMQDYFADGMTEALTTDLARMESLQVISRTSTAQY